MRKNTLQTLVARMHHFDDSTFLARQLREIARENDELGLESYWLREAAENIDGMWEIMCEAKKLQLMTAAADEASQ